MRMMFSIDISKCEGHREGPVSTRERIVELRLLCIILFAVIVFLIIYFLIFVIERRNRLAGLPHLACSSVSHPIPL